MCTLLWKQPSYKWACVKKLNIINVRPPALQTKKSIKMSYMRDFLVFTVIFKFWINIINRHLGIIRLLLLLLSKLSYSDIRNIFTLSGVGNAKAHYLKTADRTLYDSKVRKWWDIIKSLQSILYLNLLEYLDKINIFVFIYLYIKPILFQEHHKL